MNGKNFAARFALSFANPYGFFRGLEIITRVLDSPATATYKLDGHQKMQPPFFIERIFMFSVSHGPYRGV